MPNPMPCNDCERDPCDCVVCPNCNTSDIIENICRNCGNCGTNACCRCWYCIGCENLFSEDRERTSCCDRCTDCCECVYCENCEERYSPRNVCEDCEYCNDCCECGESGGYGIRFITNKVKFHSATKTQFKKNGSKRFIAAEIEVAGVNKGHGETTEAVKKWEASIVHDGSLPSGGFEINTSPANGDLYVDQVKELCGALAVQGAKITGDCGLHVHVDARDFNFYDLKKLAFLYQKIEPALFSVVPPSRRTSTYCNPCGDKYVKDLENSIVPKEPKFVEKKILENIYKQKDVNIQYVKGNKYHEARYNALNLHSYIYRGTVECRIHSGTASAEKIINWGMLWAAILDFALYHNEKQIKELRGDSFGILLTIAPNNEIKEWLVSRRKKFDSGYVPEDGEQ